MIIRQFLNAAPPAAPSKAIQQPQRAEVLSLGRTTKSGKTVSVETAKSIATAYRCGNVISDDIAGMPQQVFRKFQGNVGRIYPDAVTRNTAFLLEKQPNRWMTPFLFKKTVINWLLFWGNAYIWQPLSGYAELFILPASSVYPVMDDQGNKWYATAFPNGSKDVIPDTEMVHLMINSSDGLCGRSVLTYARETMGRQLGAHETEDKIFGSGLMPTALLWLNTSQSLALEAREAAKKAFIEAADGGVAVFDGRVSKFETITLTPADAQFLEGVQLTDAEIANFFGVPLYKLNMGKQSYESNEQQDLDYLKSTLNSYLVQWEQAAGLKWLAERDQPFQYVRFNRDSLLQTDAKTRTEVLAKRILSGMYTPNQALAIEDMNGYPGGDAHYMQSSYGRILADGAIEAGKNSPQSSQSSQSEE